MPSYIFISYAHENSRFAIKLAQALGQRGVDVWLDQWQTLDESEWQRTIERAILGCEQFLLLLSSASVASWVVREQFLLARKYDKVIIPVLHRPCQLPPELQHSQPIDFVKQNFEQALHQLLQRLVPAGEISPARPVRRRPIFIFIFIFKWPALPPFLWPGKLTSWLLLFSLLMSGFFLWSSDADELTPSGPNVEQLIVIPTATPLPFTRPQDGKPMAYIPAGEFLMGSADSDPMADEDEKPQRLVYVDAFWIDQTEITNGDYELCVEAAVCRAPRYQSQPFAGEDYPVIGVDWFQAVDYCRWAGGRLPTEAEWEKAARGTDGRIYPWGNEFDGTRLNYCDKNCIQDWRDLKGDDGYKYTAPIGNYPRGASPYGLFDMSGDVWEWTADWYAPDTYTSGSNRNPTGPASGQQRVVRGGSWHDTGRNLRVTQRHKDLPTFRYDKIGFRCVLDAVGFR